MSATLDRGLRAGATDPFATLDATAQAGLVRNGEAKPIEGIVSPNFTPG